MSNATEIIVYRNPGQKAMWDLLSNGQFFPVICGIFVFFILFIALDHFFPSGFRKTKRQNAFLCLSAVVGILVIWSMWL